MLSADDYLRRQFAQVGPMTGNAVANPWNPTIDAPVVEVQFIDNANQLISLLKPDGKVGE